MGKVKVPGIFGSFKHSKSRTELEKQTAAASRAIKDAVREEKSATEQQRSALDAQMEKAFGNAWVEMKKRLSDKVRHRSGPHTGSIQNVPLFSKNRSTFHSCFHIRSWNVDTPTESRPRAR